MRQPGKRCGNLARMIGAGGKIDPETDHQITIGQQKQQTAQQFDCGAQIRAETFAYKLDPDMAVAQISIPGFSILALAAMATVLRNVVLLFGPADLRDQARSRP